MSSKRIKISREKTGFRRQDKGNVWFIICDQVTTLCLQLDGSYKTPILFLYSENNSDFLNSPPNTNLYNVHCTVENLLMPNCTKQSLDFQQIYDLTQHF